MRKLTLPFFLLAFPALLAGTTTTAQQIVTTSSVPAFTNAVQQYNVALASQLPIYNGKEYIDYKQNFEVGQPYFLQKSWTIGTMVYENVQYAGVPIMYNLVTDEVIIPTPDTAAKIQLQKDRVQAFTVGGHLFAYVPANSVLHDAVPAGFYDILVAGSTAVYVRRTKNIQTSLQREIEYKIYSRNHYYLKKNNSFFSFRSRNELLKLLPEKRKELQQFIRQNHIKYKKDRENGMVTIVTYYNQLTR